MRDAHDLTREKARQYFTQDKVDHAAIQRMLLKLKQEVIAEINARVEKGSVNVDSTATGLRISVGRSLLDDEEEDESDEDVMEKLYAHVAVVDNIMTQQMNFLAPSRQAGVKRKEIDSMPSPTSQKKQDCRDLVTEAVSTITPPEIEVHTTPGGAIEVHTTPGEVTTELTAPDGDVEIQTTPGGDTEGHTTPGGATEGHTTPGGTTAESSAIEEEESTEVLDGQIMDIDGVSHVIITQNEQQVAVPLGYNEADQNSDDVVYMVFMDNDNQETVQTSVQPPDSGEHNEVTDELGTDGQNEVTDELGTDGQNEEIVQSEETDEQNKAANDHE